MKSFLALGAMILTVLSAHGQNTAVVTQQKGSHDVSVVQQGSGNTSVVNQSTTETGNRAIISQSGSGNITTINQGNGSTDATGDSVNSVVATQSGEGETVINQTKGGNSISVYQSGAAIPAPTPDKKKSSRQPKQNRKP